MQWPLQSAMGNGTRGNIYANIFALRSSWNLHLTALREILVSGLLLDSIAEIWIGYLLFNTFSCLSDISKARLVVANLPEVLTSTNPQSPYSFEVQVKRYEVSGRISHSAVHGLM